MTDMRTLIDNLRRSERHASYEMTVDRTLVVKLLAAAELAEAELAYIEALVDYDKSDGHSDPDEAATAAQVAITDRNAKIDAYRVATK